MNFKKSPSDRALKWAEAMAGLMTAFAPVRRKFVQRDGAPAPLAQLIRGGRGGEVRLKLYLTLLYFGREIRYPARPLAELLDLPDAGTLGARRVTEAIHWLDRHKLADVRKNAGSSPNITLLSDDGGGAPYEPPYKEGAGGKFFKLQREFWTKGWIMCLSQKAVAVYLILLDQKNLKSLVRESGPIWLSPSQLSRLYSLSNDTWRLGTNELVHHGLIVRSKKSVGEHHWGQLRFRNTYEINKARLEDWPSSAEVGLQDSDD